MLVTQIDVKTEQFKEAVAAVGRVDELRKRIVRIRQLRLREMQEQMDHLEVGS